VGAGGKFIEPGIITDVSIDKGNVNEDGFIHPKNAGSVVLPGIDGCYTSRL
jgi:hypothetical protein